MARWIAVWATLSLPLTSTAQDSPENPPADAPTPPGPGSQPENVEAAQNARGHFRVGMQHFDAREFREAIHQFQLAAHLVPSADLWFNIARAYEEINTLEGLEQAVEHYQKYLRDRVDPPDREEVETHIAELQARIAAQRAALLNRPTTGTVRVSSNVEGAALEIDARDLGQTPIAAPLSLDPGSHRLQLQQEGYIPFRADLRVGGGVTTAAYADLLPETRYEAVRGRRIFTWITAGLAVVAAGTSIGFGVHARSLVNEDRDDDVRRNARTSDYLLGAAIGLGVVAFILYFIEGRAIGTIRIAPDGTRERID